MRIQSSTPQSQASIKDLQFKETLGRVNHDRLTGSVDPNNNRSGHWYEIVTAAVVSNRKHINTTGSYYFTHFANSSAAGGFYYATFQFPIIKMIFRKRNAI